MQKKQKENNNKKNEPTAKIAKVASCTSVKICSVLFLLKPFLHGYSRGLLSERVFSVCNLELSAVVRARRTLQGRGSPGDSTVLGDAEET